MAETISARNREWIRILDDVSDRLAQSLAQAETRAAQHAEVPAVALAEQRGHELAGLRHALIRLEEQAEQARALVDQADRALQEGEAMLRQQLASAEAARQRLAAWTGRAIG